MTRRAFSLMELLVAIALILALLSALFAFSWDVLSAREAILTHAHRQRSAAALVQRLELDLTNCVVGDRQAGAGVRGDNTSLSVLSRSVPVDRVARGGAGSPLADLQRATYAFDRGELRLARSGPVVPGRSTADAAAEAPGRARSQNDGSPAAQPGAESLEGAISRLRFRYHDGTAWRDSFDSLETDALPRAVEVAIWFKPWPQDEPLESGAGQDAEEDLPPDLPERATFDPLAGFDERAAAMDEPSFLQDEPPPDRVRVIAIPDAPNHTPPQAPEDVMEGGS